MPSFLDTNPAPLDERGGIDPYAAFRLEAPRDVAALMRELNDSGTPVQLSAPNGIALRTHVWAVDADAGRLSMRADLEDPQLQPLVEADEATAVAYLEAVKLQFDIDQLVLVRGPRSCALQARMPRFVYRFQRRQAFRVRPLERTAPCVMLNHPATGAALTLRVVDVSIGGCALLLPVDAPPIDAGSLLTGARIELDADTRFAATLELRHVTSIHQHTTGLKLGCALKGLDGAAERALQRYIDQTQKRRRLLSLGS
jgi:c-di-GMP-binding flagellar brake protein YcgR